MGLSPMLYVFTDFKSTMPDLSINGHIDLIHNLIYIENLKSFTPRNFV